MADVIGKTNDTYAKKERGVVKFTPDEIASIKDGMLQASKDNDAAMDIDLSEVSENWLPITDDKCNAVYVSVSENDITLTTDDEISQDYGGCEWSDVSIDCDSEKLLELALYAGEENSYLWADSTDGERFPYRGGGWGSRTYAGVFCTYLYYPRSDSPANLGFRSAYFRKTAN